MTPRIALVCDWLTTPGGAEKVLLELHQMYPSAPIYTSQYRPKAIDWFKDAEVKTGWLNLFPSKLRKVLGPLRQLYFSHLNLSQYDLIISVTGAEAKGIKLRAPHYRSSSSSSAEIILPPSRQPVHLCYCHVPTQYYWGLTDQYLKNPGFGKLDPLVRFFYKLFLKSLRRADYRSAARPDQFITISAYAASEISKYYDRDAVIIAPPVDVSAFSVVPSEKSTKTPTFSTAHTPEIHKNSALFHNKSTGNPPEKSQKSTTYPQKTHKLSTLFPPKPATFSTSNPQPSGDLSTENSEKSTKNSDFSTVNPQDSREKSTAKPDFSTKNPQKSTGNDNFSTTFPQLFHKPTFVIACRQVTWKRVDLAISACLAAGQPLRVIGDGPEHERLVELAGGSPLIEFIPWLDSASLAAELRAARAFLFPSCEPFGLAAVEALAAGCPVIAFAEGGSCDFITPGKNGLLFSAQTANSLAAALKDFPHYRFDRKSVQKSAEIFDRSHFRSDIAALVATYFPETETVE